MSISTGRGISKLGRDCRAALATSAGQNQAASAVDSEALADRPRFAVVRESDGSVAEENMSGFEKDC